MKKKLIALALVLALVLTFGLVACGTDEPQSYVGVYAEAGFENHCYFPYAVVTLDANKNAIACEIGEAFGPTGRLQIGNGKEIPENPTEALITYSNPWYPGFGDISTAYRNATTDAAKAAAIADKYISVAGEVFKLATAEVKLMSKTNGTSYLPGEDEVEVTIPGALVFVSVNDSSRQFDNDFICDNFAWYLAAVKAGEAFPCNATGTKTAIGGKLYDLNAILKNDVNSEYYPARGLNGYQFSLAAKALADFALAKNFEITFENCTDTTKPQRIAGFDYEALIDNFPAEVVTSSSSNAAATYLHYGKTYIEMAVKAYEIAKSL